MSSETRGSSDMLLDVVVLPPVELRRTIGRKIKEGVGCYPRLFVVDNTKLIPHLSLWHVRTSQNRIDKLAKELELAVKNQRPIGIRSTNFVAVKSPEGCVEFGVKNNRALASLQQKVFKKTYPFRTGMMPQFGASFGIKWSSKELKEAKKYSRPLWFGPHFTAGILKSKEDALRSVKAMKKVKFKFLAKEIYICRVNRLWQADKILRKINFSR